MSQENRQPLVFMKKLGSKKEGDSSYTAKD